MGKGSKSGALFKDKAKNRVDDLQGMFMNLQSARKESRTYDAGVLEEQVHQMLREWKAELNEPSPASSLQGGSRISSDLYRLLHAEEEDDATSALAAPKPEPDAQKHDVTGFQEKKIKNSELKSLVIDAILIAENLRREILLMLAGAICVGSVECGIELFLGFSG